EELALNSPRCSPHRFSDPDLMGPFFHRDEHNIHNSYPAKSESYNAHSGEELLHAVNDLVEHYRFGIGIPDRERFHISRIKTMSWRKDRSDLILYRPIARKEARFALILESSIQILSNMLVRSYDYGRERFRTVEVIVERKIFAHH